MQVAVIEFARNVLGIEDADSGEFDENCAHKVIDFMPLRSDIHKVLVIGSGPIVIGQAAEFDYAGNQVCRTLREEGLEVVLINSNPATIMTDKTMADKVYIEPLILPVLKKIIKIEKPDSILPTMHLGPPLPLESSDEGMVMTSMPFFARSSLVI